MNLEFLEKDLFFFRHFHEVISFKGDLLERADFFFLSFHDSFKDESFAVRCDSELSFFDKLFLDEMRTDFLPTFRTEVFFF